MDEQVSQMEAISFYIKMTETKADNTQVASIIDKRMCTFRSQVTVIHIPERKKFTNLTTVQQFEEYLHAIFEYLNWNMNETIPVSIALNVINEFLRHCIDSKEEHAKAIQYGSILKTLSLMTRENLNKITQDKELEWGQVYLFLFVCLKKKRNSKLHFFCDNVYVSSQQ
ncbi:hypothetical protein RFI_30093 [Reticulomyxa filosa]|uniref:Uncharacterized protein n=1 Tax=Reticulomyxa filosa TaxID=46433 RepID=X6M2R9_RETFI|nr:hypothetical protein RFI_30093 [Reticulomyxa filosa]|eukprot:ETO07300.1 hypothetical protein RFI_30093 [Reticulomyxa filosa]